MAREGTGTRFHPLDFVLLVAPAFSTPLLVWAENLIGVGHPERLIVIGAMAWLAAALVLVLMRASGVGRAASLFVVWVGTYVVMRGGTLPVSYGFLLAGVGLGAALGIGALLISRRSATRLVGLLVVASALLVIEVVLGLYSSVSTLGPDRTQSSPDAIDLDLHSTPDIVLVVTDAYVGIEGQAEFFDAGIERHRSLGERGFWIPALAFSPYASTNAALPAILDFDYPIMGGLGITPATNQSLYERVGGGNRLVSTLGDNGYEVTMIESGWSGSSCGSRVDTCVASAFVDESVFLALEKTWFGSLVLARGGYAFTAGARHSMDWLSGHAAELTHNDKPDLVMAHLEIPHPPFFLDEQCQLVVTSDRGGVTLRSSRVSEEQRKTYYLEQAACVNRFVEHMTEGLAEETIVLVTGDHGSDLHHQMAMHPGEWSDDAILERLNVMFALRAPEACRPEEPVLVTEAFRSVLSCLSGTEFPPLDPRMFIYAGIEFDGEASPVLEVSPERVESLLGAVGQ